MSNVEHSDQDSVQAVLDAAQPKRSLLQRWWWLAAILLLCVGLFWLMFGGAGSANSPEYTTVAPSRGDLVTSVMATGNLKPVKQVDIGTEVSGTVQSILVDVNDAVVIGQELARLDISQLNDAVARDKATLAQTQASVAQMLASQIEAQNQLKRLQQLKKLTNGKMPSQNELDTAVASQARANANLAAAEANVLAARADLSSDETRLAKAIVVSPINGVVLVRSVEPGQTVAASLSAPTLFTLAEDLTRMELEVSVDEADVGQVQAGQTAQFTVDAWPGRTYQARISRVSLGATVSDNVVYYTATLLVDNDDESLRPGMTATATITTQARQNVILVPNAALRFKPLVASPVEPSKDAGSLMSKLMPRPPRSTAQRASQTDAEPVSAGQATLWLLRDGKPQAQTVSTGLSDGRTTEILDSTLALDARLITGMRGLQP